MADHRLVAAPHAERILIMPPAPRPLHVLHIVEATLTGTRRHVTDLVLHATPAVLPALAFSNTRVDREFTNSLAAFKARGIALVEVPMYRVFKPLQNFRAGLRLRAHISRTRPQIVHTHGAIAGIIGRWAAARARVPVIVHTPNAWPFLATGEWLLRSLYRGLERWAAQSSDAIICVSDHERQLGLSYRIAPPEKLTLIPNGADLSAVHGDRTTARTLLGLPSDALVFGSVTRFAHQKDPLGLIAALIPIAARFPHFHLVMVGEGPLLAAAGELVARHRAEGQIHLTGFRTDATALLFGFDAFLLSSRYEGLAYGVLEAMAAGLPIITTAGGNEQAVQQGVNGLVVPVDDRTALQTAVTTLLQDHHRRRSFGQQSRVRVQQFTVGGMVEKTEALYRRLVEKKGLLLE